MFKNTGSALINLPFF
jgi:hypothetical protein